MAAALPVIASVNKQSDAVKIIKESGAGFLVPAGDPYDMAEAVMTLYEDKELRKGMGEKGKAYAAINFSKDKCIDQYDKLITKYINNF